MLTNNLIKTSLFAKTVLFMSLCSISMISCKPDDPKPIVDPAIAEEIYSGGELGTTFNRSQSAYEDPTPAIEDAGLANKFKFGEYFFECSYTINNEPFKGLGPLYLRTSCIACHPARDTLRLQRVGQRLSAHRH